MIDSDTCLTMRVRHETDGSYNQIMYFKREELAGIREWLLAVSNDRTRAAFKESGEEMIKLKVLSPNDFVRFCLTNIAQRNDTVRQWLFRSADEDHPLWNSDNTIKKVLLPDGWTVVHLKGSGEAPILMEDVPCVDRLHYAYFWRKVDRAHPLDRRFMAKEYDIRRNPNGWFFDVIARRFNAVRPTDLDKDYYFELESERPFSNIVKLEYSQEEMTGEHSRFLVRNPTIGCVLGNVPQQNRPIPALSRQEIMDLGFRARLVRRWQRAEITINPRRRAICPSKKIRASRTFYLLVN